MAARSYFGKPAKELTLEEGALLAGLTKGPNYYSPDRHPGARAGAARLCAQPHAARTASSRADAGAGGLPPAADAWSPTSGRAATSASTSSTRSPARPRRLPAIDSAHRQLLHGALDHQSGNCSGRSEDGPAGRAVRATSAAPAARSSAAPRRTSREAIQRIEAGQAKAQPTSAPRLAAGARRTRGCRSTTCIGRRPWWWRSRAARRARLARRPRRRPHPAARRSTTPPARRKLTLYDVVVRPRGRGKSKGRARAELRMRPTVQGAVVVLENKTGRILAMTGGFSYPLSQLNRATQAAAPARLGASSRSAISRRCSNGLQPNTLVSDDADHAAADRRHGSRARAGLLVAEELRRRRRRHADAAARRSRTRRNLATAHLLDGGIENDAGGEPRPALQAGAGGADLSRMHALLSVRARRAAGAADRSRGLLRGDRQRRHAAGAACDRVDRAQRRDRSIGTIRTPRSRSASADRAAFYQLKTMLQGVLARGTARSIARHGALRRRQDRHHRRRERRLVRRLHQRRHGRGLGRLRQCRRQAPHARRRRDRRRGAVPIFEPIMQAVWAHVAPKTALAPPSPEAKRQLSCKVDRSRIGRSQQAEPAAGDHRVLPDRPHRTDRRHPVPARVAREHLLHARRRYAYRIRSASCSGTSVLSTSRAATTATTRMATAARCAQREVVRPPSQYYGQNRRGRSASQAAGARLLYNGRESQNRSASTRVLQGLSALVKDTMMRNLPAALLFGMAAFGRVRRRRPLRRNSRSRTRARSPAWPSISSSRRRSCSWTGRPMN